jgi:ligand-binding sensor domain-containing protein
MWIGSEQGLARFDGIEATFLSAPDSNISKEVSAIFQDHTGRLWVGYADGHILYSEDFSQLHIWAPEEGLPVAPITSIGEDANGHLWFSTYGEGLYFLYNNRLYNFNTDDGLLGNDIYQARIDSTGYVVLATDGGINRCAFMNGKKVVHAITPQDGLPDEIIRRVLVDQKGSVWLGTYERGICHFQSKEQPINIPFRDWPYGAVTALEVFQNKELWIGTERDGLIRYTFQGNELQRIQEVDGQAWGKILDLRKDTEGNLWVLSSALGISKAYRPFEFVAQKLDNIQAIYSDHNNNIWVGTQSGLFRMKKIEGQAPFFERILPDLELNVLSIFEDQFQNLWFGTFGEGVYCYHPPSGRWRQITEKDGLTNGSILSIDGTDDHIWMATLGGVTEYPARSNVMESQSLTFQNYNTSSGLGTNFIYKVFIDRRGRTWFGTDGKGLSLLENGQLRNFPEAGEVPLNSVYSITEDHRGHIWFSTAKEGIYEFDGQHFSRLSRKEGLRNLSITSLATDTQGNILIIHSSGIDVLQPETRHLIYYDEEVGINDFNPNLNVICQGKNGELWLASQNQVIKYAMLEENLSIHPRTQLTNVSVFLDPINYKVKNRFKASENSMVFEYVGLWYTDPNVVRYRYQLEGFDQDWIYTKDRQATYSNLPPGQYIFKVSSTENDAFDQEPVIQYAFTIAPPLWIRPWFIILSTFAVVLLLYYMMRFREKRLAREADLKKEKIESQYEALKSQINPHFLFNSFNTLITIIEENPELGVRYVEQLSDFYRSILQYREKETIPLAEELELVKSYFFLLKERYGERLDLRLEVDPYNGWLIVPLSLQMLVENAVKHNVISSEKPLQIHISKDADDFLKISNKIQPKRTREPSTGFGLNSISKRYELLTSRPVEVLEKGGFFEVRIPLIKN